MQRFLKDNDGVLNIIFKILLWKLSKKVSIKDKRNIKRLVSFSKISLLDHYLKSYEDFVIMADFNANESNPAMETF